MIGKLLKLVIFLGLVGFAALAGYAWFGDLSPDPAPRETTVVLDGS